MAASRWMPALHAHVNAHPLAHHVLQLQLHPCHQGPEGSPEKKQRVEETPESGCSSQARERDQKTSGESEGRRFEEGTDEGTRELNGMSEGVRILDALADQKAGYAQLR